MRDELWFNVDFVVINLQHQKEANARKLARAELLAQARAARQSDRRSIVQIVLTRIQYLTRLRIRPAISETLPEVSSVCSDLAAETNR